MSEATTEPAAGDQMSIMEHLAELRMRIIRAGLAIAIGMVIVLLLYDQVLRFLLRPYTALCVRRGAEYCGLAASAGTGSAGDPKLFNLDPISGLSTRMNVAFYGGLVLAMPVVLWQIWRFIVPALHKNEKRYAVGFVASTVALFLFGSAVAYYTLGPALEFLINWAGTNVQSTFEVKAYVRLVTIMVLAFGFTFTIPELLVFLQLIGVIKWRNLLAQWRYAVVASFVVAAVVTPAGDPISMMALGLPLLLLYFIAVLIGWLVQRRRPAV